MGSNIDLRKFQDPASIQDVLFFPQMKPEKHEAPERLSKEEGK